MSHHGAGRRVSVSSRVFWALYYCVSLRSLIDLFLFYRPTLTFGGYRDLHQGASRGSHVLRQTAPREGFPRCVVDDMGRGGSVISLTCTISFIYLFSVILYDFW